MEIPPVAQPTSEETKLNTWSEFADWAEPAVKLTAAIGLLCYAVGLIVSNSYLSIVGITDFGLWHQQCILTGCWTIALLAFAALPSVVAATILWWPMQMPAFGRRILMLVAAGCAAVLTRLVIARVGSQLFNPTDWILSRELPHKIGILLVNPVDGPLSVKLLHWNHLLVYMNLIPLPVMIISSSKGFKERLNDVWKSKRLDVLSVLLFFTFLVASFSSCSLIGRCVYGVVPPKYGGGRPQHGRLYFAKESKDTADNLKALTHHYHDSDPDGAIGGDMIYMGSDRYAFRVAYCAPPENSPTSMEVVYREWDFIADKKTMQSFFLDGPPHPWKSPKCPLKLPTDYIPPK